MNDDMTLWLPVAEHLQNISLSDLLTFRTIIDAEIALRQNAFENAVHMKQESFYNADTEKQGSGSSLKTLQKKTHLEVVK